MARHTHRAPRQWAVFLAVALSLFAFIWIAWSLANHRGVIPGIDAVRSDATVSVGLRDAPQSLDIRTHDSAPLDQALLGNVYETIVGLDTNNKTQPGLASSWKISKNALTYTFTMHDDRSFSNGHALDASDAVWSLQQAVGDKHPGYKELGDLNSVTNPNAHTLVITLNAPNPRLLRALSSPIGIVFDRSADIDYTTSAMGSGPFVVSDYAAGSSITLRRNDQYSGTPAASSQVTLHYYNSDTALINALHAGDIQMGLPHTDDLESALTSDPTLKIAQGPSTTKVLIGFNADTSSIFSDQRVRQSVRYLIDAKATVSSRHDVGTLLGGPIGTLEPGYEDLTGLFPYDAAKARSMLSYFSSSYLGTVVFLVPTEYRGIGDAVTKQLESNGPFTVHMQVVDDATLHQRMASGDYTMALTTMGGTDDASVFADAGSIFHYTNGDAQHQYEDALTATTDKDYEEKLKIYAKTVSQDAAAEWLYERNDRILVRNKLVGYHSAMSDERLVLHDLLVK